MSVKFVPPRPKRWDRPWDPDITDDVLDRVLELPVVRDIDRSQFPAPITLREILRNDARLRVFRRGEIVVRAGEYGHSAFLVALGMLRVIVGDRDRSEPTAPVPRSPLGSLLRATTVAERRDPNSYQKPPVVSAPDKETSDVSWTFLRDPSSVIDSHQTHVRKKGDVIGEMAALTRAPRAATVVAETDSVLLEIRWQGLRELRNRDKSMREYIDGLYRERALSTQLAETPLLSELDRAVLDRLAARAAVETYGAFEWFANFKSAFGTKDVSELAATEPVIVQEGHHVDGLLIVRDGFARITEQLADGERTLGYVSKGEVFGLEEIAENYRTGSPLEYRTGLRALGYVTGVWIPTAIVQKYLLEGAAGKVPAEMSRPTAARSTAGSESMVTFLVDHRVINGTAAMLINTSRCVGCDECVHACADTHDNNPRFVRHGVEHDQMMVANACMHCVDPVCLIGCPTGAIHRHPSDGRVVIDDVTCIGCSTCANSCPYDNIRMVEIRDSKGAFIMDDATGQPVVKATKCDLCLNSPGGPACERACPHDALVRIDLCDREGLQKWLAR